MLDRRVFFRYLSFGLIVDTLIVGCKRKIVGDIAVLGSVDIENDTNPQNMRTNKKLFCSISADGNFVIFPRFDIETNAIALVNMKNNTFINMVADVPNSTIEDVSISKYGDKIAILISVISNNTTKKNIWVLNNQGLVELEINGVGRGLEKPAFSLDGKKLSFFADMRHQYLRADEVAAFTEFGAASFAVHEYDFETSEFRILDLPILPFPSVCFYKNNDELLAAWKAELDDPNFSRLPADCRCGSPKNPEYRNSWQLYPNRLMQTVSEVNLHDGGNGRFKKFANLTYNFNSVRDTVFIANSACEDGLLVETYFWNPLKDPSIEEFQNPRYYPPDKPKIGLAWMSGDGSIKEIEFSDTFSGISHSCGSYDGSRVVVWPSVNNSPASKEKFPSTKKGAEAWQKIDLEKYFIEKKSIKIEKKHNVISISLPKLIDKNGVGKNFEANFLR